MRFCRLGLLSLLLVACSAFAQHDPRQIAEDVLHHRSLAQAQELAAKCFLDKKGREECLGEMKTLCGGLAIGKFCGLKEEAMSEPAKSFATTARAHQTAAQCMESGKPYEDCLWDLQTACKGLAVGKYCGMLHTHSF